jgi:nitroimidazol reductase NimA-like FMN-containing flavoprotein (pyridoxamine 5'-phosphate oxidase superfamily)
MRRRDREVSDFDQIVQIVEKCPIIHLGMIDGAKPYIVPLNFGYQTQDEKIVFYMHSAAEGRKITLLKNNPQVCFEMEDLIGLYKEALACKWSTEYESVMGEGRISFIEQPEAKIAAFTNIVRRNGFTGEINFNPAFLAATQVYRLDVECISAKRNIKS